jgi:hypothetical protein
MLIMMKEKNEVKIGIEQENYSSTISTILQIDI